MVEHGLTEYRIFQPIAIVRACWPKQIVAACLAIRRRCGIVVIGSSQSAYQGLLQTA